MAASNLSIHALQATHTTIPLFLARLTSHPIVTIAFVHILTWLPLPTPIPCLYLIQSMAVSDPSIHTLQATHTMTPLLLTCLTSHPIVTNQKSITFIQILTWSPLPAPLPHLYLILPMVASIALCSDVVNIPLQCGTFDGEIETAEINSLASDNTSRMIALCYCGFDTWPQYRMDSSVDDDIHELY